MKPTTLLVELQNLDTRIDENAFVRADLARKLEDTSQVTHARAELAKSDSQTGDLKAKLRALELETRGLDEKLAELSARLYSGRITNAKELAGLNQDEKMLQRRKSELEDQELELMEQIETAENAVRDKRGAYEKISAQTSAQTEHDRTALQQLDAADVSLIQKRDALRAQVPPDALRAYDHLRLTKKGRAVAHLKGTSCAVCGYAVPSGLISRVKLGDELVFCANCERILTL
jgi:uncharacterized protein